MPTKMKSRPQVYPRAPFHIIRAIAFVCASIVSGILIYFCVQLKHDDFKLPWTFIIILAATLSSLLTLVLSSIIYSCAFLSPLFNLLTNLLILIVWTVGLALLTWNLYGALGHSCSRANWGSDDGMMVCRTYKALYSFSLFGWLAQIAQIVLDVRSRRTQTALGKYDKMMVDPTQQQADLKLDALGGSNNSSTQSGFLTDANTRDPNGTGADVPYGIYDYRGAEGRRALREREGETQRLNGAHNTSPSRDHRPTRASWDADNGYGRTGTPLRAADFNYDRDRYATQTGYGNSGYGYGPHR
ncbi:hypothetical protein A1O3_01628 [Capronia epimyces CBS 606.96]|uniref:MARVEL domain-containing protein n=1 Tax=Capronia epimyces CBS 606.96 TaxID=1182542 RepID=W9YJI6_9EURO|nr:uncharacterized protein A1O3_01628 [Capronia epimyces CBS 606.96]EXJ93072.1 hypothetical protein A1O3_01628 [Capronia epimyces CBS 606.96]